MGAIDFVKESYVMCAEEAFREAVNDALYLYGHGGYTGSIAEKTCFEVVQLPLVKDYDMSVINKLIDDRFFDKWGPAGCIEVESDNEQLRKFVFFGMAST